MADDNTSILPEVKINAELKSADILKALGMVNEHVVRAENFLGQVIGEPVVIAASMLSDVLNRFQWKNRVAIGERASRICQAKGIDPKTLPPQFILPMMVAAGTAAEPEVQELWAQLVASAMTSATARHPAYIDVIRRLSAKDARVFKMIVEHGIVEFGQREHTLVITYPGYVPPKPITVDEWTSIPILDAAGLTEPRRNSDILNAGGPYATLSDFGRFFASVVGLERELPIAPTEKPPSQAAQD